MSIKLKLVFALLIALLIGTQYRLWVGEGSLAEVRALKHQLEMQNKQLAQLEARNAALRAEVDGLKRDDDAIEGRARSELGLIQEGETYYQLVRPETKDE